MSDQAFAVGPDQQPDKYRLVRQVGGGGEAELWEANLAFAGGQERVAVKILREHHASDLDDWQSRWTEQAELLRLVRHPGVVGVHELFAGPAMHRPGETDPARRALYLVMNWVEGQDLRDWVMSHRRMEDRVEGLRYLAQVADVLDWLHDGRATTSGRSVVHGDISPANVVVNPDGQAVLVDFGLFRIDRHVTAMPSGTPGYRAPELLRGGEYSPASDRYAFGALAYYVLAGDNPPEDPDALAGVLSSLPQAVASPGAADLRAIASADPVTRPTAGAWVRQLRMQSTTALADNTPLPPFAQAHARSKPAEDSQAAPVHRDVRLPLVLTCLAVAVVFTVILSVALSSEGSPTASPSTTGSFSTTSSPPSSPDLESTSISTTTPTTTTTTSSTTNTSTKTAFRSVPLVNLQPVTTDFVQGDWTVDGVKYKQSLACLDCVSERLADYRLDAKYSKFTATFATDANYPATLGIALDGQDPVQRQVIARRPVFVEVDVSDIHEMVITLDGSSGSLVILGRATLGS